MTLVALRTQSTRLQKHLRELPPPGVDAAQYLAALDDLFDLYQVTPPDVSGGHVRE